MTFNDATNSVNSYGIGNGGTTAVLSPTAVTPATGKTFVSASVSYYNALVLSTDGLVYGYGDNLYGEVSSHFRSNHRRLVMERL